MGTSNLSEGPLENDSATVTEKSSLEKSKSITNLLKDVKKTETPQRKYKPWVPEKGVNILKQDFDAPIDFQKNKKRKTHQDEQK